jgi:CxxC motif-containing protein (DUF1111 family)
VNTKLALSLSAAITVFVLSQQVELAQSADPLARDPGPRATPPGAGAPVPMLTAREQAFFAAGKADFEEVESAPDGLGPTMNLDSCAGCHSQPSTGGTSPALNPQIAFAARLGARNRIPSFLRPNGPVREARFVRNTDGSPDGGVHSLFTIAGRSDAPGCGLAQPDFEREVRRNNVIFRVPTPVFGAGLIEQIPDATILAAQAATSSQRVALGIRGRANVVVPFQTLSGQISGQTNNNGNDGTIARFGWKAQNKSLMMFSGEAYNVEMGISNELFPTERDETASCQFATNPNDVFDMASADPVAAMGAAEKFAVFMRLLAPPAPSADQPGGSASIGRGRGQFWKTGCALCHTPAMRTGNATIAALRNQQADLFSDLLVHDMGAGLADGVSQGQAGPREFRTAPLWGLGQRLFFLHDGRTNDLVAAIRQHSSAGSEANAVVARFNGLREAEKQDLLNFLRSL